MNFVQRIACGIVFVTLAFMHGACASAARPAGAERPRGNEPPKFAVLAASDERHASALANWKTVVGEQAANTSPTPELRPVTDTLNALPTGLQDFPRLPLVVAEAGQKPSEEETRESLRRFLTTAAPLLGVELKHVSLVGVSDANAAGAGAKSALYQQNPFPYPLRNGYGVVRVVFTPDLRVLQLSSTAIPDGERLARTLATVPKTLTAAQAVAALDNRTVNYTDPGGTQRTRTVTPADRKEAQQLVVFPVRRDGADAAALELHVAWEVSVGEPAPVPLFIYVDAVTGEALGGAVGIGTPAAD